MIGEISKRLREQLERDLEQACSEVKEPVKKLAAVLQLSQEALQKLRGHVLPQLLEDKAAEVLVFKSLKPAFYQWQVYYTELFCIETNFPLTGAAEQLAFLEKELRYIKRFFGQYAFLYQYYKLGATELDHLYFVRGAEVPGIQLPGLPEPDPGFSTYGDYLFAKFMALERLKDWLVERLLLLQKKAVDPQVLLGGLQSGEMTWTGDTIDLAEVGLAFYHTGKLNHGTAGLGEIFRWLEENFHVSIGVPAKRMAELRKRKRLSRTRYLSEMRDSLEGRMDKEDEYVPTGKKRPNSALRGED